MNIPEKSTQSPKKRTDEDAETRKSHGWPTIGLGSQVVLEDSFWLEAKHTKLLYQPQWIVGNQ